MDPRLSASIRKESSFPAEMPPIKSVGAANQQSPPIPWKFVALYHGNTKIGMRSDERDKVNYNEYEQAAPGIN